MMNDSMNLTKINLNDIALDPISLSIGLVIGLLVGCLFLIIRSSALKAERAALKAKLEVERAGLDEHFQVLAQAALQSNSENFLSIAQEKLKYSQLSSAHDLDKRTQAIQEMVKPVEKHLQQLNGVVEQLSATDKTIREDIQSLSKETSKLTGALKNPAAQGKWGEFVLERLLNKANLMKGVHYETQVSMNTENGSRLRPDAVIYLNDGFNIIVDAKAPIGEFINHMDDDLGDSEFDSLRANLSRSVRAHVKSLGSKSYWEQLDSPDFVILFLPSENIFSTALSADPDLVDFAADNNVVIASPTLMMSLIRVVGLSWRQVDMAKNAQEVSKLGSELFDRISTFSTHLAKVGGGINSALSAYNKAIGTFDSRVLVSARKLKDMNITDKEIETPKMLEGSLRPMNTIETDILIEEEKEDKSRYA